MPELIAGEAAEVEPAVQGSTAEADKVSEAEPEASDVGAAGEQSNKESDSSDDSSSDDEVLSDASDGDKERLAVIRAEVLACEEEGGKNAEAAVPRTKNECTEDQLPALEKVDVQLEEDAELMRAGRVSSIVGQIIVVRGTPDQSALAEDSILFTEKREPVGRVFETFGRVREPHYSIRFDGDLLEGVEEGSPIFYTQAHAKFILAVDIHKAAAMKGSDASNMHDEEPPVHEMEFSDDEEEQAHKRKLKSDRKRPLGGAEDAPETKGRGGKGKGGKSSKGKSKGGGSKGFDGNSNSFRNSAVHHGGKGSFGGMVPPDMMANYSNYQMPTISGHGQFQPMMGHQQHQQQQQQHCNYQMPMMGGQDGQGNNQMSMMGGQGNNQMPMMGGQSNNQMPMMGGQGNNQMPMMGGQGNNQMSMMGGQGNNYGQPQQQYQQPPPPTQAPHPLPGFDGAHPQQQQHYQQQRHY